MSKFQIGDRVRVYGHASLATGKVFDGTIDSISFVGMLKVGHMLCHPKQCRRLVKKPRQLVWIHKDQIGDEDILTENVTFDLDTQISDRHRPDYVCFVRKDK